MLLPSLKTWLPTLCFKVLIFIKSIKKGAPTFFKYRDFNLNHHEILPFVGKKICEWGHNR